MTAVLAVQRWKTNAHMIADVATLGYLEGRVLDPTFGTGGFWKVWRPVELVAHDLATDGVDVRALPYPDGAFDAVVFDPPYKLNGRPDEAVDRRYGVHEVASRAERFALIFDGMAEGARVLAPRGHLLVKCQDQVNGGKVRWQTDEVSTFAREQLGLAKVDRFDLLGHRPQPSTRRQVHAHRGYSTLLVFQKPRRASRPVPAQGAA